MKKKAKIITVLIIGAIILLIGLFISIMILGRENNTYNENIVNSDANTVKFENEKVDLNELGNLDTSIIQEDEDVVETEEDFYVHRVENKTDFYTVKNCVAKFLDGVRTLKKDANRNVTKSDYNNHLEYIYNQLSDNYITENNITLDNLEKKINLDESNPDINIVDMLELRVRDNQVLRFVLRAKYLDDKNSEQFLNCILYMDYLNLTYSIEPIDNNITDLSTMNLNTEMEEVSKNKNNTYTYELVTD